MERNKQARRPALLFDPIGVEVIIEGCDVDAAIGNGESAPVVPGFDLVAAGP
jgi:hypothetical protein